MVRRIRMYEDIVKAPKLTIPYLKKVLSEQGMSVTSGSRLVGRDTGGMTTSGYSKILTGTKFSVYQKNSENKPEIIEIWFGDRNGYEQAVEAGKILADAGFYVKVINRNVYVGLDDALPVLDRMCSHIKPSFTNI